MIRLEAFGIYFLLLYFASIALWREGFLIFQAFFVIAFVLLFPATVSSLSLVRREEKHWAVPFVLILNLVISVSYATFCARAR